MYHMKHQREYEVDRNKKYATNQIQEGRNAPHTVSNEEYNHRQEPSHANCLTIAIFRAVFFNYVDNNEPLRGISNRNW